jgi:hypothetical protein
MKPNLEMIKWFMHRTLNHIESVQKNLSTCAKLGFIDEIRSKEIAANHDLTKFNSDIFFPYILITWKYKCDYEGIGFELDDDDKISTRCATFVHTISEEHHPEYWDSSASYETINIDNRDKPSGRIVDSSKMPDERIIEMICDWAAVAEERGNSIKQWFDANNNKRWKFSGHQIKLINKLIGVFE